MGRKFFVSYKYKDDRVKNINFEFNSKVRSYVDELEDYFDETDHIYKGESDGEDLSEFKDDTIWSKIKDRIYDSSITIVMISKGMREKYTIDENQWIPWEISYSLKEITRENKTSRSNAVLAIVLPDENGDYGYYITDYGCHRTLNTGSLFAILTENMFNKKVKTTERCCRNCESNVYKGEVSYIQSIKWEDFIKKPNSYIEKAINLKENINEYDIQKEV